MKERLQGFVLMTIIVPLALIGYLVIVFIGFFGKVERARGGVRALNHFVNAAVFNGYAWESVCSHAWRDRHKPWAKAVIWIMDFYKQGHCERSNRREQEVLDLALKKELDKSTI